MQSFESLREQFSRYLANYHFPNEPAALYGACRHILSIGGKRIRPVLCLMAADAFAEVNTDSLKAALAVELFHNFSLVHDDIMDKADIRRGQQTVHKMYSEPTAILSGDVLNVYAYQLLNELEFGRKEIIFNLFNKTAIEVCEGQQMDMDFEERIDVRINEYLKMISLKTSVLLACSLEIGALLGNASAEDAKALYEFGKNVGIAFQLKDDYLDAYGDQAKTGKKVGGDILANKKTIFYCYCRQHENKELSTLLLSLQNNTSPTKVQDTLNIYNQLGAPSFVQDLKEKYSKKAFDCLEKISICSERKESLGKLADSLLTREY